MNVVYVRIKNNRYVLYLLTDDGFVQIEPVLFIDIGNKRMDKILLPPNLMKNSEDNY